MATCRCGAWAGGPEAPPYCTVTDCELRAAVIDLPKSGRRSVAFGRTAIGVLSRSDRVNSAASDRVSPCYRSAGGGFDQRTSDRQAEVLRCGEERAAVHEEAA